MFTTVLSKNAQNALAILGESRILPKKTYLAGGSALALQYGHRISIDFDFFTPLHFKEKNISKQLATIGDFKINRFEKDTLLGEFNKVKFSLFTYSYSLVKEPTKFLKIDIASPEDIAAMKIAAIMDRGTKKDFIDLYFLIENGISIENSFTYYNKKYKSLSNNLYSIMKSLSYFDDADLLEMPQMIKKISWEQIKKFFKKEVILLAKKYIG